MKANSGQLIKTIKDISYGSVHGLIEVKSNTTLTVLKRNDSDDGIVAEETVTLKSELGTKVYNIEVWDSNYEVVITSESEEQSIEIDCPPLSPRPDSYITNVMKGSGVDYDGREPVSKVFGCWKWDFSDIAPEQWKNAQPVFKERIKKLNADGWIRYGSW